MKTFLTIIVTALLTWVSCSLFYGFRSGAEHLWLVSAVKAPGRMAISEILADMNEERHILAKAKLQVFWDTWQRWDKGADSFSGRGIGDVMVAFSAVETNRVLNPEPDSRPN